MSMYGKNHYNIVISLQQIKINEKKLKKNLMRVKRRVKRARLGGAK